MICYCSSAEYLVKNLSPYLHNKRDNALIIMEKIMQSRLFFFVTIIFTWLSVAGIADNVVEWKKWFEIGIMEHWRTVRHYIISWIPFDIHQILVDYLVLGSMYSFQLHKSTNTKKQIEMNNYRYSYLIIKAFDRFIFTLFTFLIFAAMWPFMLFADRIEDSRDQLENELNNRDITTTRNNFLLSLIIIIPILFIATDLISLSR